MIRVADLNDLERLCELYKELHEYHVGIKPEKFRMPEDDEFFRDGMVDFLNSDDWITIVHETDDGQIDGYAIFKAFDSESPDEHPRRVCYITHLMVTESSRRQGAGTELINKVSELARSVKCTFLRLGVNALNSNAIAFDKQMGFENITLLMEKKL